jgi:hypothetical protein
MIRHAPPIGSFAFHLMHQSRYYCVADKAVRTYTLVPKTSALTC